MTQPLVDIEISFKKEKIHVHLLRCNVVYCVMFSPSPHPQRVVVTRVALTREALPQRRAELKVLGHVDDDVAGGVDHQEQVVDVDHVGRPARPLLHLTVPEHLAGKHCIRYAPLQDEASGCDCSKVH